MVVAAAREARVVQKWEYTTLHWSTHAARWVLNEQLSDQWQRNSDVELMQILGREGWELVGISSESNPCYYFKRPLAK